MGRMKMSATNSSKIKKRSDRWIYLLLGLNLAINAVILLHLYGVI
jgi:hypothetical protein